VLFRSRSAAQVVVEVLDEGPGIPPEETERIKRPFARLESARSDATGAGLGLAIVDRVARAHGGELQLLPRQDVDGRAGLAARIVLPFVPPQASPPSPAPSHEY
jgi:two-component system osmolarity sensor histidine kinase EnvZ